MTSMRSRLILPLALLAGACASTPDGSAQELAGRCYYFEQDATARSLNLPWGVRLTDQPLTGWPALAETEARVAVTLMGPDESADHPFGYWQSRSADSVRLGYPGMGGLLVDAHVEDAALVGTATPVGDADVDDGRAHAVRLIYARCPGE
jgi:hypothetical protein